MNKLILSFSGLAMAVMSSCVNPPEAGGSAVQNRFGYQGSHAPAPAAQVHPVVTGPTVATDRPSQADTRPRPLPAAQETVFLDNIPPLPDKPKPKPEEPRPDTNVARNNANPADSTKTTKTTNGESATEPKRDKYLYGIPVPGRDGMVFSPYNRDEKGYIDVRSMKPGALAEDPYAPGKLFRVP